ncbi:MAG: hypothetical protein LQ339_005662 [Xanthoria mediterranea]|nr:MAG: hypothetical protein LQ339_005662 [Xanthoria mediterranea]
MTHSSFHIWCKACDRDFVSEEARLAHWENNDAHLSSYCADCEWDYVDPKGLKIHDRERHANRFCPKCDRSFDSEVAHISHTASKHKDIFCPDCQLAFDTSDALKQHWRSHDKHVGTYDFICDLRFPNQKTRTEHLNADPVKHFVCVRHQQFCGSQRALEAHYLKAHPKCTFCNLEFDSEKESDNHHGACHSRCLKCKLWFKDNALRNEHYMSSTFHEGCHRCKQGFEGEPQLARHHWNHHAQCSKCNLGFENDVRLNEHYKNSKLHAKCVACDLGFPDEQERQHHYWGYHTTRCSKCKLGFENDAQLQQHYNEVHKPESNPKPEVNLKPEVIFNANIKPVPENKPKPEVKHLRCLANCSSTTIFPPMSAVIEHLENGTCSKGWTIQRINNLLVKLPVASAYMIWDNIAYFLAGPPRLSPNDDDQLSRGWRCYLCKVPHLSPLDLQRHLQEQDCHTHYPHVVRCPHCPDHKGSFDRMSTLLRHLERRECGVDTNAVYGIVEDVKEKMSLNVDGKAEELKVLHQLRIDASKGGKDLIVKSSMNSK